MMPRERRQRMVARRHHHHGDADQRLGGKAGRLQRQRADNAQRGGAVQQRLIGGAQRLNEQAQRRAGKFDAEFLGRFGDRLDGKHHIHHHRQFRLQPRRHAPRPGLHEIHIGGDGAGVGQQHGAFRRQFGGAAGAVEQGDADLAFQPGHQLADRRLSPAELAGGGGKAAFIDRGDEGADLVQGNAIQHYVSLIPILIIGI